MLFCAGSPLDIVLVMSSSFSCLFAGDIYVGVVRPAPMHWKSSCLTAFFSKVSAENTYFQVKLWFNVGSDFGNAGYVRRMSCLVFSSCNHATQIGECAAVILRALGLVSLCIACGPG